MTTLSGYKINFHSGSIYYEITVETIKGRLDALTWCRENMLPEDYFVDLWDFNFKRKEDAFQFKLMGF